MNAALVDLGAALPPFSLALFHSLYANSVAWVSRSASLSTAAAWKTCQSIRGVLNGLLRGGGLAFGSLILSQGPAGGGAAQPEGRVVTCGLQSAKFSLLVYSFCNLPNTSNLPGFGPFLQLQGKEASTPGQKSQDGCSRGSLLLLCILGVGLSSCG